MKMKMQARLRERGSKPQKMKLNALEVARVKAIKILSVVKNRLAKKYERKHKKGGVEAEGMDARLFYKSQEHTGPQKPIKIQREGHDGGMSQ